MQDEVIIFRENESFKATTKENYFAYVRDARKIWDFSSFDNLQDVIEYIKTYFKTNNIIFKGA